MESLDHIEIQAINEAYRSSKNIYDMYSKFIREGDISKIRACIREEVPWDVRGPDGGTLLHAAVWANQTDIAELLIEKGLRLDDTNSEGETPFILAMGLRMIPID